MVRVFLILMLITVIGGLTPIGARMAVAEMPPMVIAWVRFATAGVLLWGTVRARGHRLEFQRRDLPKLLGLGLICVPINQIGFLLGVKLANASHAALFYALAPVIAFWISFALRQIRFNALMLAAAGLAAAGAACVIWPSLAGVETLTDRSPTMLAGDVLLFLAVASWATFLVLSRPVIRNFGPLRTLTGVFLVGAVLHAPIAAFFVSALDLSAITWRGVAGLAYITLVTSFLNYLLFYIVLVRYEATRAMIVVNGTFLVTVAVEWLVFGERLTLYFFLGGALIVAAIALDVLSSVRR